MKLLRISNTEFILDIEENGKGLAAKKTAFRKLASLS
jgi:hypothetical protein